ncbi:site-specific DNA-methyltransferase [Francisella tularensis]|uniref:site-specific DNA-methyltransferase n=1 Tax=Francisella tularensis TaxID=263 RepID=UPI0008F61631|nr:site-specific DNA-methyltransferase [Francisella tularensis]APA83529.1 Type III restriction-modification system methylation subunit [Francisella tularensis subsp. novicida PA10-7858]
MNQKYNKLKSILKEMFQLDQTDLDFGIYRIMNQKADEISNFLDEVLPKTINQAFQNSSSDNLKKELKEAEQQAIALGIDPNTSPKVQELKKQISKSQTSEEQENEIYSQLTQFFSRYYKDGDFISLRRYKKDTYAIPYEGEEVKLHWANSDQYYIKTSENFRDYTFKVDDNVYHFKLVEAETDNNNNKSEKDRRFVLAEENSIYEENGELYICFEYIHTKGKQDSLNKEAVATILANDNSLIEPLKQLKPTDKNKTRTILEKHLTDYTAKNSFDYFIHKDLKGFLTREMDFYIKNEMLDIDNILDDAKAYEGVHNKIRAFKNVATKIIEFLSQLEEFQKKLWLKKKFVIGTNYCITLDKIVDKIDSHSVLDTESPNQTQEMLNQVQHDGGILTVESIYNIILENKAQLKEWQELYSVEINTKEDLENDKYLVLDTKFFDAEFKHKILSLFENIDEECDGVLINSENFGALNLLQERYKEQVKTVYIDPPYNTGGDGFLYRDSFQHSSWMSFMFDRLSLGKELMSDDGVNFSSIDDYEQCNLKSILDCTFNVHNMVDSIIVVRSTNGMGSKEGFATNHEYLLTYKKSSMSNVFYGITPTDDFIASFNKEDEFGKYKMDGILRKKGDGARREDSPGCYYPLYYKDGKVFVDKVLGSKEVLPKLSNGKDGRWTWSKNYAEDKLYKLYASDSGVIYIKDYLTKDRREKPKSVWKNSKYITDRATNEIKSFFRHKNFSTPKPINLLLDIVDVSTNKTSTILDYFAGSGTTGHATIKLNREDGGKRKYLLVEMGEYFDSVTKPRIQKIIYSDNWKAGKPQDKDGISQMFKYFKLESYEDTLNNISFSTQGNLDLSDNTKEDYVLNYMLDYETNQSLLDIDNFKKPFNYKLNIATSSAGETVATDIDLVETFNYLIGLKIKTWKLQNGFLTITGSNLKDENITIVWRDDKSNTELNDFVSTLDLSNTDILYTNGDNNIDFENVRLIEEEFKKRMFEV